MNQENASQKLRVEIEALISDVEHETIGWNIFKNRIEKAFQEAKELEKQQIIYAYIQGREDFHLDYYPKKHAQEYYDQTFIF